MSQMSEIEKAREAREKGYGCADEIMNSDAAAEKYRQWSAQAREALVQDQLIERRMRAIAREEIEAVKGEHSTFPTIPSLTGDPELDARLKASVCWFNGLPAEQQEEHLRKQRESWVRGEMGLGLDNKRAIVNQEGGDPRSSRREVPMGPAEDKSPPAVETPAAGALSPLGGITIRADEPNIVIEGFGRPDLSIGSELADMTALARRLAEALYTARDWLDVDVPMKEYRQINAALAEARKHKLIE